MYYITQYRSITEYTVKININTLTDNITLYIHSKHSTHCGNMQLAWGGVDGYL